MVFTIATAEILGSHKWVKRERSDDPAGWKQPCWSNLTGREGDGTRLLLKVAMQLIMHNLLTSGINEY